MKILLTGATGGIGSAIKVSLSEHELTTLGSDEFLSLASLDWLIFAQGKISERNFHATFEANILSCISITQAFLPGVTQGVIYISSTAGIHGSSMFPIYAASKAALNTYTISMAKKHPDKQFYAICPGPTDTKMWRSLSLPGEAQAPSKVADVVKLCLEGAFTSGDIITVRDGVTSV